MLINKSDNQYTVFDYLHYKKILFCVFPRGYREIVDIVPILTELIILLRQDINARESI